MKAYGRHRRGKTSATPELSEIHLFATPDALRALATFLADSAEQMEQHGSGFGHNHFRDAKRGWQRDWADIIVARPDETPDSDDACC